MDVIVQWATILSPIIAVLVAWWMLRCSAKDTAEKVAAIEKSTHEQISALEKSTKGQIESVKQLTEIKLRISILQANVELKRIAAQHKLLSQRMYEDSQPNVFGNQYGEPYNTMRQENNRKRDMEDEQNLALSQMKELHELTAQLNKLNKMIGGD